VLPTPFTPDEKKIDEPALRQHVEWLLKCGVKGLIPLGSTGEVASLTEPERGRVTEILMEQVAGRAKVVVGVSANATRDVVRYSRAAKTAGADGLMITHPYYCLPTARELERHYRDVAQSVDLPIIIYNNPFTTGVDMLPQAAANLANSEQNIKYIKESSADVARVGQILARTDKITVLCGWDNLALESYLLGARGWVAGIANLAPRECLDIHRLALARQWEQAREVYTQIYALATLLETSGRFVAYIKGGLDVRGQPVGTPLKPILPLDKEERATVTAAMARLSEFAPAQ
jgi:4-hydroxy-tetrahydrodipicolinate synthase